MTLTDIQKRLKGYEQNYRLNNLEQSFGLALEWGKNWLQPIQDRIRKEYPTLNLEQADYLDVICHKAMSDTNKFIETTLEKDKIDTEKLEEKLIVYLSAEYAWIDQKNFSRLFSQACYYAWKDGLL